LIVGEGKLAIWHLIKNKLFGQIKRGHLHEKGMVWLSLRINKTAF
jgi:hypothetical protein